MRVHDGSWPNRFYIHVRYSKGGESYHTIAQYVIPGAWFNEIAIMKGLYRYMVRVTSEKEKKTNMKLGFEFQGGRDT